MCLDYSVEETKQLLKRFGKKEYIYLWKTISRTNHSPYQYTKINAGWYKADVKQKLYLECEHTNEEAIFKGIHVYRNRDRARRYTSQHEYYIKVKCYKKDLVAAGDAEDAVFNKIWIDKSQLRKPVK